MGKRRTPANFPRMKHRAAKRRAPRIYLWDAEFNRLAGTYTRFMPDIQRIRGGLVLDITGGDPCLTLPPAVLGGGGDA